ncbi:hypothetical protein AB0B38_35400 [Streptomyces eurythermus]
MADRTDIAVGIRISTDIEHRPDRPAPYRARVRWWDPTTKRRQSLSEGKNSEEEAQEWLQAIVQAAQAGLTPSTATMTLAEYGEANMDLALRGLELKTLDPYLAGWRPRVVPALGHLAVRLITNGEHHRRPGPRHGTGRPGRHHHRQPGPRDRPAEALQAGRGRTP